MKSRPFDPMFGSNKTAVLGAAANAAVNVPGDNTTLRVCNAGTGDLYVYSYSSLSAGARTVATTGDYPVLPGMSSVIFIGDRDRVNVMSVAGTTYHVMSGNEGV